MTLSWKTKLDRNITIMKDRISRLLHHHCEGMLQGRGLPSICIICKHSVVPFPAVLALRDARVYICPSNYGDVMFYVETSVHKIFSISTILWVLNVNLYNMSKVQKGDFSVFSPIFILFSFGFIFHFPIFRT